MTQEEFKEIFDLHKDSVVTKSTVKAFGKILIGAHLLHEEIMNTKKLIPTTFTSGNKVWLSAYSEGHSSWRDHVMDIGSFPIIWVYYGYKKNGDNSTPFWTFHSEENKVNIDIAYALWGAEFAKINAKYTGKYGVKMEVDLDKYMSSNRWFFRTGGIEIITPIFYKDKNGFSKQISNWDMRRVIIQQNNIFLGKMPEPMSKVIRDYNKKKSKKQKS